MAFTGPIKFALLIILLAHRTKRYIWSARQRLSDCNEMALSMCDKAQYLAVSLLLLHATTAAIRQDLDGILDMVLWTLSLVAMAVENKMFLCRSPELKLCWILDTIFKTFQLRMAVLNFFQDEPNASRVLFQAAASICLSTALAVAGFVQIASIPRQILEQTYGRMSDDEMQKNNFSSERRSWASIASFSWINKILSRALNGRISEVELRPLEPKERSSFKRDQLLAAWNKEKHLQQRKASSNPRLWKALSSVFAFDFLKSAILRLISLGFELMGPLLLQKLIQSIEEHGTGSELDLELGNGKSTGGNGHASGEVRQFAMVKVDGVMLAIAIGLCTITGTIVREQWFKRFCATNMQIRGSLTGMIFRKAFVLSAKGRQGYKIGELISLMSVDASRLGHSMHGLHMLWSTPLMVVITSSLIYSLLGPSILAGLCVPLALVPINFSLVKISGEFNKKLMKVKDERANLMDEVVHGIRIIKYFAWEPNFEQKVQEIRTREIALIWRIAICNTAIQTVSGAATMLIALVTFATYTWEGSELKPSIAFGALALFKVMEGPLRMLGLLADMVVEGKTALGRLRSFFQAEELDRSFYKNSDDLNGTCEDSVEVARKDEEGKAIEIIHGTFSWPRTESDEENEEISSSASVLDSFRSMFKSERGARETRMKEMSKEEKIEMHVVLKDINLEIKPRELCMITGKVGAGKTSLLSAILGEVCKTDGTVTLCGKVAYAPQQSWIFNASVRENILFGSVLDQDRYKKVLDVCCLGHDIRILPAGDQTEIGEKGPVNLSGGQKARICLARAVYQQADVYLFDDPLSAVDVHVSQTMFNDCIKTFLSGKTRVLVTHQVQYIGGADMVVHLNNGAVVAKGTPELVMCQCPELILNTFDNTGAAEDDAASSRRDSETLTEDSVADTKSDADGSDRKESFKSVKDTKSRTCGAQIIEEEMLENSVELKIWKLYAMTLGVRAIAALLVAMFLHKILSLSVGWWLSVWSTASAFYADTTSLNKSQTPSQDPLPHPDSPESSLHEATPSQDPSFSHQTLYYITGFALIDLTKNLSLTAWLLIERFAGLHAATVLHDKMLQTVLRVPVEFFDTTPSGRILNRFTSDVHALDRDVAGQLNSFVAHLLEVIMTCGAIALINPSVLVIAIPAAVLFLCIQRLFKKGCLQLQRLESITKSPLFAHFSESLNGVSTVRAFSAHNNAMDTVCAHTDRVAKAWLNLIDCHQWLTVRITSIASFVILATSIAAVLSASPTAASAAATGLVITYAFQLTGILQETVRAFTLSEQSLVSVERVSEYGAMEREGHQSRPQSAPKEWPSEGKLVFESVEMRYRKDLEPALKGLNFKTSGGEKIGVVGRTGAGKSSIAVALFRLAHVTSGTVRIDGVDASTLGIEELRRKLSIIPQDPVLFSGSIRSNLDPFNSHPDDEVWSVLERVHMKDVVAGFRSGLAQEITQGGANLSIGQRQLFCLARALLRKAKVIIMDEATASVDMQTDGLIQDTIRTHFKASTVLTIAHRLDTVMCCDRVMVLGEGRVLEIGAPRQLARDSTSVFRSMVSDPKAKGEMLG